MTVANFLTRCVMRLARLRLWVAVSDVTAVCGFSTRQGGQVKGPCLIEACRLQDLTEGGAQDCPLLFLCKDSQHICQAMHLISVLL